jgi:hypothetical protein
MELLAKSVTPFVTVFTYDHQVKIVSNINRRTLVLSGEVLSNFFGNQEYLVPFVEVGRAYMMIGSSSSKRPEAPIADLVIEKANEAQGSTSPEAQLYRFGYSYEDDKTNLVLIDDDGLKAIIQAARIALWPSAAFVYDDSFWVVKAFYGAGAISMSTELLELEYGEETIWIRRENMGKWLMYLQAIEEISDFMVDSYHAVDDQTTVSIVKTGMVRLSLEDNDSIISIVATVKLFMGIQVMIEQFWLCDDGMDPCDGCEFAEEYEDDDDEGEGSAS